MLAQEFIRKWTGPTLKQKSAEAPEQFIDVCHRLGEPTAAEADPTGKTVAERDSQARRKGSLGQRSATIGAPRTEREGAWVRGRRTTTCTDSG